MYRSSEDDYTFWPVDDEISRRLGLDPSFASPYVRAAPLPPLVVNPSLYKVGNKCPPKEHQFKEGNSGNPTGRPKRRPSFHSLLTKQLQKTVTVSKNGKSVRMTNYELIAQQLISSVFKKDWAALKILKTLLQESFAVDQKTATEDCWAAEQAAVDNFVWTDEMEQQFREIEEEDEEFFKWREEKYGDRPFKKPEEF